jgi:hypothetical protein
MKSPKLGGGVTFRRGSGQRQGPIRGVLRSIWISNQRRHRGPLLKNPHGNQFGDGRRPTVIRGRLVRLKAGEARASAKCRSGASDSRRHRITSIKNKQKRLADYFGEDGNSNVKIKRYTNKHNHIGFFFANVSHRLLLARKICLFRT